MLPWLTKQVTLPVHHGHFFCSHLDFILFRVGWWLGGGLVLELQTLNREVLGLIPTRGTMLCP